MERAKLTTLAVDRAHRSGKPLLLSDGDGLYLRKQTRNGASWTLRYHFGGREHWLTLGHYPDMSLAQARIEARKARVLLDKQQDPLTVRRATQAAQRQRGSFRELCEEWYRNEIIGRGIKHPSVPRRHLDKYLVPKLGRTAAADVTAADIAREIDDLEVRAPTAANDLLRFARRIFAFGVRRRIVPANPAADFSPRLDGGGTERPRSRALSLGELAQLFSKVRETPSFGTANAVALKLLLALCVRKGELLGARWEEFDLDGSTSQGAVWHLPASRTKTATALDIPLVPEVVGWLRALKAQDTGGEYLFPKRRRHRRARVPHVGLDTLNVALQRVKHGLPPFTLHDLRRTARTQLAALGIRREVAERCLGHQLRGVEATYDRHDYFKERRAALEQWTALLIETERGESKITPITRARDARISHQLRITQSGRS
ncbi:MAG: integrase arm-type DNA-binding domain-containing protein [Pseudomonadota bacterium]|jgi:integrase|nr:integrase arm-type DNA-binding domain-containing protein [Pseudomonadota bacterium]